MIHTKQVLPEVSGRLEVLDDGKALGHISNVSGLWSAYAIADLPGTKAKDGKVCVSLEQVDIVDGRNRVLRERVIESEQDAIDLVVMMHRYYTLDAVEPEHERGSDGSESQSDPQD